MRSSLFWDVTQRRLVVNDRRFGTAHRSQLQGSSRTRKMFSAWTAWPRKLGPTGRPETTVTNYKSTLNNITKIGDFKIKERINLGKFLLPSRRNTVFSLLRFFQPTNQRDDTLRMRSVIHISVLQGIRCDSCFTADQTRDPPLHLFHFHSLGLFRPKFVFNLHTKLGNISI